MSFRDSPRFSPLMVSLVPGGPSLGDTPLTTGLGGPSSILRLAYYMADEQLRQSQSADANKSTPNVREGVARKRGNFARFAKTSTLLSEYTDVTLLAAMPPKTARGQKGKEDNSQKISTFFKKTPMKRYK